MSDDGADMGVSADRALKTVLGGGAQPTEDEKMDPIAFEKWIMSHTSDPQTYGGTAAYMAKLILDHLRAHPDDARIPTEAEYEDHRLPNGERDWSKFIKKDTRNLSDVMDEYPAWREAIQGATGFMWGWAVNAARRCCELPPVPNPAIVTVGGG